MRDDHRIGQARAWIVEILGGGIDIVHGKWISGAAMRTDAQFRPERCALKRESLASNRQRDPSTTARASPA